MYFLFFVLFWYCYNSLLIQVTFRRIDQSHDSAIDVILKIRVKSAGAKPTHTKANMVRTVVIFWTNYIPTKLVQMSLL